MLDGDKFAIINRNVSDINKYKLDLSLLFLGYPNHTGFQSHGAISVPVRPPILSFLVVVVGWLCSLLDGVIYNHAMIYRNVSDINKYSFKLDLSILFLGYPNHTGFQSHGAISVPVRPPILSFLVVVVGL